MENINIGISNLIISNKLKDSYFNNELINESKKIAFDFFDIVKNSPILQLEFKVFNNIENKHIENDLLAKEFIDNNIKVFEVYTHDEIENENNKLKKFLNENINDEYDNYEFDSNKVNLYNAINLLITESLKIGDSVDIDNIHESFTLIFNHIKTPKKSLIENVDVEPINEEIIGIAVNKFNEKYSNLDENDKNLLKTLIKSSNTEKEKLLETYKKEIISIIENMDRNDKDVKNFSEKAIIKINEMIYNQETVDNNIIELHEFKKELI